MIDQELQAFLDDHLPADYRQLVVDKVTDVHPTQVSHVRHGRREDQRGLRAMPTAVMYAMTGAR